jgi:hypothetical protein
VVHDCFSSTGEGIDAQPAHGNGRKLQRPGVGLRVKISAGPDKKQDTFVSQPSRKTARPDLYRA